MKANCIHTATFVGVVVGFLNVFSNTPAEPPPCRRGILMTTACLIPETTNLKNERAIS
jgi:hypothetical protein